MRVLLINGVGKGPVSLALSQQEKGDQDDQGDDGRDHNELPMGFKNVFQMTHSGIIINPIEDCYRGPVS